LDITPVQPVKNIPSATNAICLFRFIPASQQKPKIFGPTYDKAALMSSKFWKFCTRIKSLGNYRFEQILEQFRLVVPISCNESETGPRRVACLQADLESIPQCDPGSSLNNSANGSQKYSARI
jgi:hypothetical protein